MGDTEDKKVSKKDMIEKSNEDEGVPLNGMKHPLEHTWSFWMFTNEKKNWEQNLVELTTFETIEDYWCLYHHMKLPSELRFGQDYSVFKKGIQPMWEDRANKRGGRWLINIDKINKNLDRIWLNVVLLIIGENFRCPELICGAVVNVRGKSKVSIWVADINNERGIKDIGKKLKEELQLPGKISFHQHNSVSNLYTF